MTATLLCLAAGLLATSVAFLLGVLWAGPRAYENGRAEGRLEEALRLSAQARNVRPLRRDARNAR